jgi:hypothetical protein
LAALEKGRGTTLSIPEQMLRPFTTSKTSKQRIIEALRHALQLLKRHPSLSQLTAEMRNYQLPDDNVVQDSVLSLAIAREHAGPFSSRRDA